MSMGTGLCECTKDVPNCLDTICCFPCSVGRQCASLDGNVDQQNMAMCCCSLIFYEPSIWACCIRKKLNEVYNMGLSPIDWCCVGLLCPYCSLCQTHRELTLRQKWPGGPCCGKKPFNMA